MRIKKEGGFTLVEVIVVAGIIAILAGALIPLILKEIDESRITRAYADIRAISSAMLIFKKDTGQWPVYDQDGDCNTDPVTFLISDGTRPTFNITTYDISNINTYNDHLPTDAEPCYNNWKGPYIARIGADPWGNYFFTNVDAFSLTNRAAWIMSAGPDGKVDTGPTHNTPMNDDIAIRLK